MLESHHLANGCLNVWIRTSIVIIVDHRRLTWSKLGELLHVKLFSEGHFSQRLCELEASLHGLATFFASEHVNRGIFFVARGHVVVLLWNFTWSDKFEGNSVATNVARPLGSLVICSSHVLHRDALTNGTLMAHG